MLAISLIIQGNRSAGQLSGLLANIITDFSQDGVLNADSLGTILINQAILLDTTAIKACLNNWYSSMGLSTTLPDFGKYISEFIANTKYKITLPSLTSVVYPVTGSYGNNILYFPDSVLTSNINYSLAAQIPQGAQLMIIITSLSSGATWYYIGSGTNWKISGFSSNTQTFTAIQSNASCDLEVFFNKGYYLVQYFENGSTTPTKFKTITAQ